MSSTIIRTRAMIVLGFIAHYNENEDHTGTASQEFVCNDGTPPKYRGGNFDKVVALIGEQSSEVTMQVRLKLVFPVVFYSS